MGFNSAFKGLTVSCVKQFYIQARSQNLRKATIRQDISVRPSARNISASTGRITVKFDIWVLFEHLLKDFNFH